MLPPVSVISASSSAVTPREVLAATEALASQTTAPDGALALSLAVNSSVEGKLNMLLINARERMINSLFAVIDAVSRSLALPRDAGETNAAYALRLADTVSGLSPKEMSALQQSLAARGQTAPLALVAAALHDPAGPEAAQLVAYLEVVRYKEKDLATRTVVASYGQNDGNAETGTKTPAAPVRSAPAQAAMLAAPPVTQPPQSALRTQPTDPVPQSGRAPEPVDAPEPPAAGQARPDAATYPPTPQPATARMQSAAGPTPQPARPEAANTPAQIEASTDPATAPRANQQIQADIKEGLKVVFDRLVQATGTQLLQTLDEAAPLADKAIAQALIADMIDGTELSSLPAPDLARTAPSATAVPNAPVTQPIANRAETPILAAAAGQAAEDRPEQAPSLERQAPVLPSVLPPGVAVGFVTAPYAPAIDAVKRKDAGRIDRVDEVDDDQQDEQGHQAKQDAEPEDEPETPAEEALDMLEAHADEEQQGATAARFNRSELAVLPRPAPAEPPASRGYDLYRRMGA